MKQSSLLLLTKNFFDKNPELLSKCVSFGLSIVNKSLIPLEYIMKYLAAAQNMDPNEVSRRELVAQQKELNHIFDHLDTKEYDKNFSWDQKKFNEITKKMQDLKLNKENFMKITDLSKFPTTSFDDDSEKPEEALSGSIVDLERDKHIFDQLKDLSVFLNASKGEDYTEVEKELESNDAHKDFVAAVKVLSNITDRQLSDVVLDITGKISNKIGGIIKREDSYIRPLTFKEPATRLSSNKTENDLKFKGDFRRAPVTKEFCNDDFKRVSAYKELGNHLKSGEIKEQAQAIQQLIDDKKIDKNNVDDLHGLDKRAVAYWKKNY